MEPEVVVALVTGITGLVVGVVGVPLTYVTNLRMRRHQTRDLMARYRDPLLWAVHDLRNRLWVILYDGHLAKYGGEESDEFRRNYSIRHTMFVLAEYFGWVEILRRSIGFLDLGDHASNRRLVEQLVRVRQVLWDPALDRALLVPSGQQRAIGELMLVEDDSMPERGWRCLGVAEFCERLDDDPRFSHWFTPLERQIRDLAAGTEVDSRRMRDLITRLDELIGLLGTHGARFPPLPMEERAGRA
ncbi:hypothetical protein ABGB17_01325 [Sphaerisporangium sp. B11E5]|uniref:hypothetical protein n=1 Tax=Sphaerisporangium sp. B11E5 TaxID=3153563 RepID=UPI00325DA037